MSRMVCLPSWLGSGKSSSLSNLRVCPAAPSVQASDSPGHRQGQRACLCLWVPMWAHGGACGKEFVHARQPLTPRIRLCCMQHSLVCTCAQLHDSPCEQRSSRGLSAAQDDRAALAAGQEQTQACLPGRRRASSMASSLPR